MWKTDKNQVIYFHIIDKYTTPEKEREKNTCAHVQVIISYHGENKKYTSIIREKCNAMISYPKPIQIYVYLHIGLYEHMAR